MPRTRKNNTIKLDANLDITCADTLLESAREWCISDKPIQLDAKAVERVCTPCIQILLALCTDRKAAGQETQIKSASDIFTDAVETLQLTQHFEEYLHG